MTLRRTTTNDRLLLGGVIGPVAFIGAWAALGATRDGYSSIGDTISELAEAGSGTRWAMTAGLLVYAAGLLAYSAAISSKLDRRVAIAATINGVASIGVAATPLGTSVGGVPHATSAGIGYVTLAAMALLAARPLRERGDRTLATASTVVGVVVLSCLAVTLWATDTVGFWQRLGLTIGDMWLIGSVIVISGRNSSAHATGSSPVDVPV